MAYSRLGRLEEKKQRKRLLLALVGSVGLVLFLVIFGLRLVVGFSVLVDTLRGAPAPTPTPQALLLPPILDPLPVASNSATFKITGTGQQGLTAILYLNDKEAKRVSVSKSGSFSAPITLKDGPNTVSAKFMDAKGNISELSNILTTTIKKTPPILEIDAPQDNATVNGDSKKVTVTGKTEDETTVTVNGRFVVLKSDNSFSYDYALNDGDNNLSIQATDQAGNTIVIQRKVTYKK